MNLIRDIGRKIGVGKSLSAIFLPPSSCLLLIAYSLADAADNEVYEPTRESLSREHSRKGIVYDDPHRIRMGTTKTHDGDIRFTRSKDGKTIYATRMSWPQEAFTLTSLAAGGVGEDVEIKTIALLGSNAEIQWERTDKGIVIIPPSTPVFESKDWPVMFKLKSAAQ